jgi:hypothetical protein
VIIAASSFLVLKDVMSMEWLDALRGRVAALYDREADRVGVEFKVVRIPPGPPSDSVPRTPTAPGQTAGPVY